MHTYRVLDEDHLTVRHHSELARHTIVARFIPIAEQCYEAIQTRQRRPKCRGSVKNVPIREQVRCTLLKESSTTLTNSAPSMMRYCTAIALPHFAWKGTIKTLTFGTSIRSRTEHNTITQRLNLEHTVTTFCRTYFGQSSSIAYRYYGSNSSRILVVFRDPSSPTP